MGETNKKVTLGLRRMETPLNSVLLVNQPSCHKRTVWSDTCAARSARVSSDSSMRIAFRVSKDLFL